MVETHLSKLRVVLRSPAYRGAMQEAQQSVCFMGTTNLEQQTSMRGCVSKFMYRTLFMYFSLPQERGECLLIGGPGPARKNKQVCQ